MLRAVSLRSASLCHSLVQLIVYAAFPENGCKKDHFDKCAELDKNLLNNGLILNKESHLYRPKERYLLLDSRVVSCLKKLSIK